MDIKSVRRTNLKKLVEEKAKNQSDFARLAGTTASYISQLLNPKLKKGSGVGSNFARKLEETFSLEEGWMDIDHAASQLMRVSLRTAEEIRSKLDENEGSEKVVITVKASTKAFAFVVQDDAMDPVIARGWTIVVDPGRDAKQGDIVMLATENGVFVRELVTSPVEGDGLKPANPRYNIEPKGDNVSIVGVVLESIYRQRFSGSTNIQ